MEVKLLTVKDLASRWQCDEGTIRRYISEGTITQCKGVPGIKFHPEYIAQLEGVKLDKFSPLERRKLIKQVDKLENENEVLKEQLKKIIMLSSESLKLLKI